jgi:ribosomal protein L30E
MIHLFKHSKGKLKGKFDIALIVRGKYIVGSNQGYEKRRQALKAMMSIAHNIPSVGRLGSVKFQDDTIEIPVVYVLNSGFIQYEQPIKPHKKYQPQTK